MIEYQIRRGDKIGEGQVLLQGLLKSPGLTAEEALKRLEHYVVAEGLSQELPCHIMIKQL